MLILSRKEQERIRIGNDIIITVIEIVKGKVRIGLDAPSNMRIERIPPLEKGKNKS